MYTIKMPKAKSRSKKLKEQRAIATSPVSPKEVLKKIQEETNRKDRLQARSNDRNMLIQKYCPPTKNDLIENILSNLNFETKKQIQTEQQKIQQIMGESGADEATATDAVHAAFGDISRAVLYVSNPTFIPQIPPQCHTSQMQ